MSAEVWVSAVCAGVAAAALLPVSPGPRRMADPASSTPATGPGGSRALPRMPAAVGAGVATWVLVGHLPGLLLAPLVAAGVWRWAGRVESGAARRRREALTRRLPLVVDLMAACLAVGASPAAALAQVAGAVDSPMREELGAVAARLRLGADPTTVWEALGRQPQLGPLGRTLARAARTGASVADAMSRLAEDLRRSGRTEAEGRARAVGVKAAAPLGLCLLPAFVLVGVVPLVAGAVSGFLTR